MHVNKEIYQPKQYRYLEGINRYDRKKDKDYIQYFKAWNASFNYKGFNLDMNNDVEYECVPSALFNTYGIKKDNSCKYLPTVKKGGSDYVKSVLNGHNQIINYISPYDQMIKNDEKMIKEYINQYEYDTNYEFDVKSVEDIKNKRIQDEIISLYESIDEYTEQKTIMDNKFKVYNTHGKKGYSSDDIIYFCNYHKIKGFGYDWKMQQLQIKMRKRHSIKIYLHLCFISMIFTYI